jgi:hypothetical protein
MQTHVQCNTPGTDFTRNAFGLTPSTWSIQVVVIIENHWLIRM